MQGTPGERTPPRCCARPRRASAETGRRRVDDDGGRQATVGRSERGPGVHRTAAHSAGRCRMVGRRSLWQSPGPRRSRTRHQGDRPGPLGCVGYGMRIHCTCCAMRSKAPRRVVLPPYYRGCRACRPSIPAPVAAARGYPIPPAHRAISDRATGPTAGRFGAPMPHHLPRAARRASWHGAAMPAGCVRRAVWLLPLHPSVAAAGPLPVARRPSWPRSFRPRSPRGRNKRALHGMGCGAV